MDNNIIISIGDILDNGRDYIFENCKYIGMDTETTGLNPLEDKLCIIQISASNTIFIIKYVNEIIPYNLIEILKSKNICKVFHHANFDLRFLMKNLDIVDINNVVCTKIAAKLLYGIKDKNSLKDLLYKYLEIKISKEQQLSDWSNKDLTDDQISYAVNDVKYLVNLWCKIEIDLKAKGLLSVAQKCFDFLPIQAYLQNKGIENIFIY